MIDQFSTGIDVPPRRDRRRAAFSMIELMVAMGIFIAVMTMVMGSLTSMTSYSYQETSQSDMVVRGREAARLITNDIANTAWIYDFNQITNQSITTAMPNTLSYTPPTPYQNNPLLPWVWIDSINADGKSYNSSPVPNYVVATAASITTSTNLPLTSGSHPEWEKDTFEYLKVRTADNVAYSPSDERYEIINQTTAAVTTLDKFPAAPASQFMIVNDNYPPGAGSNDIFVSHVWEAGTNGTSKSSPGSFDALNFNQNQNAGCLRHYHLEVINAGIHTDNPAINTGTLVRRYWNGNKTKSSAGGYLSAGNDSVNSIGTGNAGWNPDDQQILLYNVQAFVVRTTYQPLANATLLQPNQISITIVMQNPTKQPGVYNSQTITFIAAMRSMAQN